MRDLTFLYVTVEFGCCRLTGSGQITGTSSGEHYVETMKQFDTRQAYHVAL